MGLVDGATDPSIIHVAAKLRAASGFPVASSTRWAQTVNARAAKVAAVVSEAHVGD
jgi:hypothetical protein